jgi:hypothetical protein
MDVFDDMKAKLVDERQNARYVVVRQFFFDSQLMAGPFFASGYLIFFGGTNVLESALCSCPDGY